MVICFVYTETAKELLLIALPAPVQPIYVCECTRTRSDTSRHRKEKAERTDVKNS